MSFSFLALRLWIRPIKPAEKLAALDQIMRALNHPARRQILMAIHFRNEPVSAGQIAARFQCAWPTTTRHLNVLNEAELLNMQKKGRMRLYSVNNERLRLIEEWLGWFSKG